MTQWLGDPTAGRDRGPVGLVRTWVEVIVHPRRFFDVGVQPGDQAPGLIFAMVVVLVEEGLRFGLVTGSVPAIAGNPTVSAGLALGVAVLLVTPAVLHLTAALQTLLLIVLVSERAGVSETVQTIAYASAPCALAGIPSPELRVLCTAYGAILLAVGISEVHDTPIATAVVGSAVPSVLVFGYGFRGFDAAVTVLGRWYII